MRRQETKEKEPPALSRPPSALSIPSWSVSATILGVLLALTVGINDATKDSSPAASSAMDAWNSSYPAWMNLGTERCTIPRIDEAHLTPEIFRDDYWKPKRPVIIRRTLSRNERARNLTLPAALRRRSKDQAAVAASMPLAGMESYAFRDEQRIALLDYLEGNNDKGDGDLPEANVPSFSFGSDVLGIARDYEIPDVVKPLQQQLDLKWNFQLALAKSTAGLAFHWHADVFAEVLHGTRRWFLTPPEHSPVFNPRQSSAAWLRDVYTPLYHNNQLTVSPILECTLGPNEALFVPENWFHATLSLGQAVSLTTSFAPTARRRWHTTASSTNHHKLMLDYIAQEKLPMAIHHAQGLQTQRPHSFHPVAWLGVLWTRLAQNLTKEAEIGAVLSKARNATAICRTLNPLYAPCHVWQSRQLTALALLQKDADPVQHKALLKEAAACRQLAGKLSDETDDEILDPKWQPKSMRRKTAD